jgi:hypothetical protein
MSTYQLHFENHPEPVEITAGYGFKAPKSWGRMIRNDVSDDACCPDLEINPLAEIDQRIQVEETKLAEMVSESEANEILKAIGRLDIRALTAGGHDRRVMLASQRFLKVQQFHEAEAKNKTEIGNQQARIDSLHRLRSAKRKDLSK